MDTKEIVKGREIFKRLKDENDKKLEIRHKLCMLESSDDVKTYLNLLEKAGINLNHLSVGCDEEQLAFDVFDPIAAKTQYSNEIFVYVGEYDDSKNLGPVNCRLYKDLENKRKKVVNPIFIKNFEWEHNVIIPSCSDKLEFYNNLRKQFFYLLTNQTQEEAIQKVLKIK